jgi:hypothetical protein
MQVKCILKYGMRQVWSPDFVLNEFKTGGTCLLGDLRDPAGSMSGNNIRLEKQKFGRFNQGGYDIPEHTNADTLIVMGGRSSIVKWFRFHGNGPTVFQGAGECELFTYVLRLKRRFDKDLTMIVIAAYSGLTALGNWDVRGPIDMRNCPEAKNSPYGNLRMCDFTPKELGDIYERLFAGQTC